MKHVKFLSTSAGTYGVAHEGDELVLKNSVADQLEKKGVLEITGDAGDDEEESVAVKGSLRIHDETGKSAAAGETNEKNPLKDKPSPKAAPLKTKKGKK